MKQGNCKCLVLEQGNSLFDDGPVSVGAPVFQLWLTLSALLVALFFSSTLCGQLISAELNYSSLQSEEYEITLVQYLPCTNEEVASSVEIAIYQGLTGMPRLPLLLELDTMAKAPNALPLTCPVDASAKCYVRADYKGKISLRPLQGGYDIVWQMRSWNSPNWVNLEPRDDYGASILLHLEDAKLEVNASPMFLSPPPFAHCIGSNSTAQRQDIDRAGAEKYEVKFTLPFSASSKRDPLTASTQQAMLTPEQKLRPDLFPQESPPPYETIDHLKEFSANEPFGKGNHSYDPITHVLDVKATKPGAYLVGMTVEKHLGNKKVSESQRVMCVQVYQ